MRDRYEAYCRRQARALASILPTEAVRPLYARAREWSRTAADPTRAVEQEKDPLALLVLYLRELLPLPPMDVWLKDRIRHFQAHLEEEFESAQAHRRPSPPVTVESRSVILGPGRWTATLNLFRRDEAWRGFIAFHPVGGGDALRTTDIFREEDPEEIKGRFLAFHDGTLQAFLRSVLP